MNWKHRVDYLENKIEEDVFIRKILKNIPDDLKIFFQCKYENSIEGLLDATQEWSSQTTINQKREHHNDTRSYPRERPINQNREYKYNNDTRSYPKENGIYQIQEEDLEPMYEDYQILGDSQMVRFSKTVFNYYAISFQPVNNVIMMCLVLVSRVKFVLFFADM